MAMPETAVDEADSTVAAEDKIGRSRETPDVEPEPESACMKRSSKSNFRFGVFGGYARHHSRPRGLVDNIGHRSWCSATRASGSRDFTRATRPNQVSAGDFVNFEIFPSLAGLVHRSTNEPSGRRS